MTLRLAARVPAAIVLGGAVGIALAGAFARFGPGAALLPALAAGFVALALRPKITLALLAGSVVVFEDDPFAFLYAPRFFSGVAGPLEIPDLLMIALICGVVVDFARRREAPPLPGPFVLPLLLLAAAAASGIVAARFGEADPGALFNSARKLFYLVVLPFLVPCVLKTRADLRAAVAVGAGLVLYKAGTGAVGWALGIGREVDGSILTYYAPTPNFLLLVFLLALVAALLTRTRVPRLLVWAGPLALAVLLLSFRRNWWIALVLGIVLVLLVVTGRKGRALIIPAGALVALALWFGLTALSASQSDSPVVQRAQSLTPTKLQTGAYDRYRIDEQRNVRAEIASQPLTGSGLGVPWRARYPLAVAYISRDYTHVVLLWYWLKLGIVGMLAYLWIVWTAVRSGFRLWRIAPDVRDRVVGLALAVGFVGLAVAETTGSFLGVDGRFTVAAAFAIGWLGAAVSLAEANPGRPTPRAR